MLLATGNSISFILRIEPTDIRYGIVCHGREGAARTPAASQAAEESFTLSS
jgi:hypothetical protein